MWKEFLKDERAVSTIEIVLILVGIFPPYFVMDIVCIK